MQPDTIIPDLSNPQSLNRYSYTLDNPIRYNDPSGHKVTCDVNENCNQSQKLSRVTGVRYWKTLIKDEFGIQMANSAKISWSLANVQKAYKALDMINTVTRGNLKTMVGGTTFTITDGGSQYYGITDPTGITFHVANEGTKLPLVNFLHETGHLMDFVPATNNVFSGNLPENPSWVKNGYVNSELLLGKLAEPVQARYIAHEDYDPNEYWADAFANYVAGNINKKTKAGMDMAEDVAKALRPYINP